MSTDFPGNLFFRHLVFFLLFHPSPSQLLLLQRGGRVTYMGPLGTNSQIMIDYFSVRGRGRGRGGVDEGVINFFGVSEDGYERLNGLVRMGMTVSES